MSIMNRLSLSEIESRVCDIAAEQMGLCRSEVHSGLRLIQDLHCDSLDAVELLMEVEDEFDVALPNEPPNMAYKAVFTREQFRLRDLAELVYLQQGCGRIKQNGRRSIVLPLPTREMVPLTQLGARLAADSCTSDPLFESLGNNRQGFAVHRRRADGMICVRLPGGGVVLGADAMAP